MRAGSPAGAAWPAWLLAATGGYVDATGYLLLSGLFTSHMSGNTVLVGVSLGQGDTSRAVAHLFPIFVWVAACAAATIAWDRVEARLPHRARTALLGAELLLLCGYLLVGAVFGRGLRRGSLTFFGLAFLAAAAMGVQNVALRRVGSIGVKTTFMSGMLMNVGESIARAVQRQQAAPPAETNGTRLAVLGCAWLLYLGGAVAGALLTIRWSFAALAAPIFAVATVAAHSLRARTHSTRAAASG